METGTEFLRGSQKFIGSWTSLTSQNRRPKFYGLNYVWPDSCSNGIRRRHNGSVIYPVRFPFLFIMETGTEFLRGSQKFIWSWTSLTSQNRRPKFYGLNYVRPEFSRMRYVGGLCRPRSFLYQNFLFLLTVELGTTFDLIPASTGYVGATRARSYLS